MPDMITRNSGPPAMPAVLGVGLRRETAADRDFLASLYISVRWPELEPSGWPDPVKQNFLCHQFALQTAHYAAHYAGADFWIVTRAEQPIGRLYLHGGAEELRVVDISLLPGSRGGGIGTALLRAVQAEAKAAGKLVSIHVESFNPARALYRRLGFEEIEERAPYWLMHWHPGKTALSPEELE